jgi:phenylalanyl-tRNA synthetase beta chain
MIDSFDFPIDKIALVELDLGKLASGVQWKQHEFASFSRYPSADRDLALVVDADVPAERLLAAMEDHELVVRVVLFDVFEGEGLTPGKKSLAYRLTLQSSEGTLTAEQVSDAVAQIVRRVEAETGATLRS